MQIETLNSKIPIMGHGCLARKTKCLQLQYVLKSSLYIFKCLYVLYLKDKVRELHLPSAGTLSSSWGCGKLNSGAIYSSLVSQVKDGNQHLLPPRGHMSRESKPSSAMCDVLVCIFLHFLVLPTC